MDTYSTASSDYQMFNDKAEVTETPKDVTFQEMLKHMFVVLIEYDKAMSQGQEAAVNPMSGRIIMNLDDGSSIEIPESIQRLAIVKYLEMKNSPKGVQNVNDVLTAVAPQLMEKPKKSMLKKIVKKGFYVLLIVAIVYMLYKYFNKDNNNDIYNYEF